MQRKILNQRYELERKIGEGGMARVYRGRDLRLNRCVAIKVLHSHYSSDAEFLRRFHHEAQVAASLRHANVVDVYDVGQDDDIHYIVMEYVEGRDLKSLILHEGPLPVEQAIGIACEVAEGLEAAHRIGLVHRDIKPQNIIVDPSGRVKITDFGIAKSSVSTASTATGVIFGTADYLSPEQARGQPATPASDIYALGVTLYEMLTGRLPFVGDSSIAVALQHVSAEPPPLRSYNPHVPPHLQALVLRALSKDPALRPASAREFVRLLRSYHQLVEQETLVRPLGPRAAPPRRVPAVAPAPIPRTTLPPRPVVVAAPPPSHGIGVGGFLLGLLLLAGVLAMIYLFASGVFDGMFNFSVSSPPRPSAVVAPTTSAETPTTAAVQVEVPDLVGLEEQEALETLQELGLQPRAEMPRNSTTISAGLVLDQRPLAGTTITATEVVTYVVSLGPEPIPVPDLFGFRASDAQRRLEQAGFAVEIVEEPSRDMSEGFVTRTDPRPPARLPPGEPVVLYVSVGDKVRMPDVTGMTEEAARQQIESLGLFVSWVDYQGRDKLGDELYNSTPPGTVVSSVPRGGTLVPRGEGVTLGVRER